MSRLAPVVSALAALLLAPALRAEPPAETRYLAQLAGEWDMHGTMGAKALHYRARGRWTLNGAWLELWMQDVARPPGYEARVYLGYDGQKHDFIAHWLDRFGAAGARVVGSGTLNGRTLVLEFPYPEGAFRDTLTLAPDGASGTLLLEQQEQDGHWSTFARYTLARPAALKPRGGPHGP
jgi:hypothetical protein